MSRRVLVTLIMISLVIVGLGGLVVFSQLQAGSATRPVWVVSASVLAGDKFSSSNVQLIKVPGNNTIFDVYTSDPRGLRAALDLPAKTPLVSADIIKEDLAEVPVVLKSPLAVNA